MNLEQEIRMLKEQVRSLSQRIEQRPVVQTVKMSKTMVITVNMGNILASGQNGIKYQTGTVTSVPSLYNPNVTSSFIDGIGRGVLYLDGVVQPGYVLVVNDDRGGYRGAMLSGDGLISTGAVSISAPGGSITAYTAG